MNHFKPDMVVHAFNPNSCLANLACIVQYNQGYVERLCLTKIKTKTKKILD